VVLRREILDLGKAEQAAVRAEQAIPRSGL
jgi:hypothetical protein